MTDRLVYFSARIGSDASQKIVNFINLHEFWPPPPPLLPLHTAFATFSWIGGEGGGVVWLTYHLTLFNITIFHPLLISWHYDLTCPWKPSGFWWTSGKGQIKIPMDLMRLWLPCSPYSINRVTRQTFVFITPQRLHLKIDKWVSRSRKIHLDI